MKSHAGCCRCPAGGPVAGAPTGWGQREDRRRSAKAGFNHHLVNPPERKVVENVLAEPRWRQARRIVPPLAGRPVPR
jgi:hypothetical protein